jgi:hypothetical protein
MITKDKHKIIRIFHLPAGRQVWPLKEKSFTYEPDMIKNNH